MYFMRLQVNVDIEGRIIEKYVLPLLDTFFKKFIFSICFHYYNFVTVSC